MTTPPRPISDPTVVAVDWSGRRGNDQIHAIRAAVLRKDAEMEVWSDLTRDDVVTELLELREPNVVVGIDFSFGYPAWVGQWHGCRDGTDLWPVIADDGERWLEACPPPFYGAKGTRRPTYECLRACERRARAKSTFQVQGAGHVGTGTIRGISCLMRLRAGGFAVWPFDAPGPRTVVEIYPTALRPFANLGSLPRRISTAVANNENTRDAVASALVMWEHRHEFAELARATDETTRLEGDVWLPYSAELA